MSTVIAYFVVLFCLGVAMTLMHLRMAKAMRFLDELEDKVSYYAKEANHQKKWKDFYRLKLHAMHRRLQKKENELRLLKEQPDRLAALFLKRGGQIVHLQQIINKYQQIFGSSSNWATYNRNYVTGLETKINAIKKAVDDAVVPRPRFYDFLKRAMGL